MHHHFLLKSMKSIHVRTKLDGFFTCVNVYIVLNVEAYQSLAVETPTNQKTSFFLLFKVRACVCVCVISLSLSPCLSVSRVKAPQRVNRTMRELKYLPSTFEFHPYLHSNSVPSNRRIIPISMVFDG